MSVAAGRTTLILAALVAGAVAAMLVGGAGPPDATAASHREAPLISMDPEADITDFFLFRSYEENGSGQLTNGDRAILIMDVLQILFILQHFYQD